MADKTKFFRVATEGATATDGREIKRAWIEDMAAGYNPATYGARVNMEHIRGATGTAPFKALGDVVALKAEKVTIQLNGQPVERMALYAQIDPTADLVALTKGRQKIYTSIEVAENFANTGRAGLVGLAVTDTPASLATEILKFSAGDGAAAAAVKADLDRRKTSPANLFSATEETAIELEAAEAAADPVAGFFAKLTTFLSGSAAAAPGAQTRESASGGTAASPGVASPGAGGEFTALKTEIGAMFQELGEGLKTGRTADQAAFAQLRTDFDALKRGLETTDASGRQRPVSAGGGGDYAAVDF